MIKRITSFVIDLLTNDSGLSTKSFSMLAATLTAVIIGLCIGAALLVDAWDGEIDSDMDGMAWLLLADGSMFGLGGITKYLTERKYKNGKDNA